jgi:hypothetical protein
MTHDPFAQVRQAHRICGAYYQQILPMINEVAQRVGTSFLLWEVWSFNKPANKKTNPFETWRWDYMPMLDVSFVFSKQEQPDTPMTPVDYVLDFKLVTDSELEYRQRELQYGEEEPLATKLKIPVEKAKSYLNIYLFSAVHNDGIYLSAEKMWNSYTGYPKTDSQIHLSDNGQITGIGFSIPLMDIANDDGVNQLVEKISEHRKQLQER